MVEAVQAALEERNGHALSRVLTQLVPRLTHPNVNAEQTYAHWCRIAQRIAKEGRAEAQASLTAFAPVISAIGGHEAIEATATSALDVRDWFL